MRPFRKFPFLAVVLIAIAGGLQHRAGAEVIVYTDRTAWSSTFADLMTIMFAGLGGDPNGSPDTYYPSELGIDGVTFLSRRVTAIPYLYVRTQNPENFLFEPPDQTFCEDICLQFPVGSGIDVVLPAGTTSVGWDFANFYGGIPGLSFPAGLDVAFADGTAYENDYTGGVLADFRGSRFIGLHLRLR